MIIPVCLVALVDLGRFERRSPSVEDRGIGWLFESKVIICTHATCV